MRGDRDTQPSPAASIVIATHNRHDLLRRTLDALARQEGAPPFEVVVVDDASTDGTWDSLKGRPSAWPFPLHPVRVEENRGPAHARNLGWRSASADVVCFTDDDCVATPTWLANLLRHIEGADVVQGFTEPNPMQIDRRGPFSRSITVRFEEGFYETCNIAYRRPVLERLGGFDESFRYPFGEDCDLAWRAKSSGSRTAFAADAVVYHDIWPSDLRAAFRNAKRLEGIVHATKNHPALRDNTKWRVFGRGTHPAALQALAGLGLVAARPRSLPVWTAAGGLGLWYAWVTRRHRHKPPEKWQWIGVVPAAFTVDLYEIAVMAKASLRYRTFLI